MKRTQEYATSEREREREAYFVESTLSLARTEAEGGCLVLVDGVGVGRACGGAVVLLAGAGMRADVPLSEDEATATEEDDGDAFAPMGGFTFKEACKNEPY